MSFRAVVYAYLLGGITFLPLLVCAAIIWTIYTSVPVGDPDPTKLERKKLSDESKEEETTEAPAIAISDQFKPRKGWLTVRRTFEEKETEGSYVNMMRTFLDSRSKDPKRSRPKDMWYIVLKGNVLYLYEDEAMTECEAAIQVSSHQVVIFPEGLMDGELFTKRNAICLKPHDPVSEKELVSITREMELENVDVKKRIGDMDASENKKRKEKERLEEVAEAKNDARNEAFDFRTPWFIFVRSCVEMEDWYLSLVHAANFPLCSSTLEPVRPVFQPSDMHHLVSTLDEQPDVIPMRWLNALIGRLFFSFYRTQTLESFIIGRLMKKLSKVKTPSFLQNIIVTDVSVGNTPPSFSKPMLKELTKEGDAALEIRIMYKGEIRLTVEATAIINLGQRFKTYTVKLVLAVVLRKLDGNLIVKVKRPPTNRIWYAFTQPPEMVLDVEPVVSDRQIKWSMILSTIESRLKEIINESVVLPNMDDIAFFETSGYHHRGGIWADASRKERTMSEMLDGSIGPKTQVASDVDDIPKSQSVDVILDSGAETSPNPDVGINRAETVAAPEMVDSPKRKSWFGSVRSTGPDSETVPDSDRTENRADHLAPPDDERGRSPTIESFGRRATSVPSSKSTSAVPSLEVTEGVETDGDNGASTLKGLSPDSATSQDSSSSTFSRLRSLSSGANVLAPEPGSSRDSITSRGSNASNTSSFLSTLKSKADKQALSNTAKEAMRKWSANWNGFKRDHAGGSNSSEETADGATQGTSSLFSFPTKGRNYADIRAAVTGRRGGDRTSSSEERTEGGSAPIDIPIRKREDESVDSSSASSKGLDATPSTPPNMSVPLQSPRGPSLLRRDSNRSAPSPPRVTTETHSAEIVPDTTPCAQQPSALIIVPPPSPPVQAPPIKTQPSQAAVMTIPGIHAKHKGEVMSMGYVPPPPITPEPKQRPPAIPPTIQNMYRLFKSPTASESTLQQQQQATPTSNSTVDEPSNLATEANDDVIPLSLSPSLPTTSTDRTAVSPRPGPPPLPPRSLPASALRSPSPTVPLSSSLLGTPLGSESAPQTSASSASEILKLIAEQDQTKRRSLDASPEPKRSKRDLLGARRITSAQALEELKSSYESEGHHEVPDQEVESLSAPSQRREVAQQPTELPELSSVSGPTAGLAYADTLSPLDSTENRTQPSKPTPPPLPPRKPTLPIPS